MEESKENSEKLRDQLDQKEFGENVFRARREKDITQEELARRIGRNATGNTISRVENGYGKIRLNTFFNISEALSVTPNELCPRRLIDNTPLEYYRDLSYEDRWAIGEFILILLGRRAHNRPENPRMN